MDVDQRTLPAWTNYLNSKTSLRGPQGPGWSQARGAQALLEEDLRRIYFQALASGDAVTQDQTLEELMVVNPKNPDYPQWKKLLEQSRRPPEEKEAVLGSRPVVPRQTSGMGRLTTPGPEFFYEWDLAMPPEVQAEVLQQLESWRRKKNSGWSKVQLRVGPSSAGPEGWRRVTVYPLTLWQANELTTVVRGHYEKLGSGKWKSPAPDLAQMSPGVGQPATDPGEDRLAQMVRRGQGQGKQGTSSEPTYSFTAKGLPVLDALALFGRLNQLNIVPDPEVQGTVTVDFRGLSLDKAMEAILESLGAYAEGEGGLIRVRGLQTRVFTIDYLRLKRSGKMNIETDLSSGNNTTAGGSGGGGGSGSSGKVSIDSSDEVDVWKDMAVQIQTLLSAKGKVAVNSLAGTVIVTDAKKNVEQVGAYIGILTDRLNRQVDLDVRVLDVEFLDDREFAIDWNQVVKQVGNTALTASALLTPSGIPTTVFPGLSGANIPSLSISNNSIDMIIKAIEDQGKVRVASQPRVRTLNHQTSIIKVVREDPFFTSQSNVLQSQSGNAQGNNVQVNSVETGTVLAITPQISDDQKITLEILPSITTLAGVDSFVQPVTGVVTNAAGDIVNSTVQSTNATAPRLRAKQASTVVRVNDQDTVVMGGFIEDQLNQVRKKVPVLGDIPLLGTLFTGMADAKTRREMVFLVSPSIVRDAPLAQK
jgi:MSHA type pilus biogenesis protein MshL